MPEWTLTVSDLNEYVRRTLAGDPMLRGIRLRGEVSNFKRHVSGHWYFSLKDEQCRIACVLFRQYALRVRCQVRDGMRVTLTGSVGLYPRDGQYQFYAEALQEDGVGELYLRFEALKRRLAQEGLFDAARKRPLPLKPRRVGIVTSETGAVVHDIARVAARRNPYIPLLLCPVAVQGEGAAQTIAAGIAQVSRCEGVDVVIVGRGGGSLEDLWAFNEETVARAIAACPVPVVSAVGHETDVTIADFAADVRAATPSAAAELAVPAFSELARLVRERREALDACAQDALARRERALLALRERLLRCAPQAALARAAERLSLLRGRMQAAAQRRVSEWELKTQALRGRLLAVGPREALARGYAIALKNGAPVTDIRALAPRDQIDVLLAGGRIRAAVCGVEGGDPFGAEEKDRDAGAVL